MLTNKFGMGKGIRTRGLPQDKIYTPENVAKTIINLCPIKETDTVLDAFAGKKVFYDNYPKCIKSWCEIDDGVDFFEYKTPIDWIITNPPYSILEDVLKHSFEIAQNVVYLLPLSKLVSSMGRIRQISAYGGVKELYIFPASVCGFPFGFPACAVWIQKDYTGDTYIKELKIKSDGTKRYKINNKWMQAKKLI